MSNRIDRNIAEAGEAVGRVMDRHTPGPWQIEPCTYPTIRDAENRILATAYWPDYDKHPVTKDECEANAKLMAGAPMLVAKLRELYAYFDDIGDGAPDASPAARGALRWAAEITETLEQAGVKL